MEIIRGKLSRTLDLNGLMDQVADYKRIALDLGTGDGRYVHTLAEKYPDQFLIGLDACRENLHERSRTLLPNLLFVIATAKDLPCELSGLISHITINFPWGSLLASMLNGDTGLLDGLSSIARQQATLDVCLNSGAMEEQGMPLDAGADLIQENLLQAGWKVGRLAPLDGRALRTYPTTWARRLAHGRDPRAMRLSGRLIK